MKFKIFISTIVFLGLNAGGALGTPMAFNGCALSSEKARPHVVVGRECTPRDHLRISIEHCLYYERTAEQLREHNKEHSICRYSKAVENQSHLCFNAPNCQFCGQKLIPESLLRDRITSLICHANDLNINKILELINASIRKNVMGINDPLPGLERERSCIINIEKKPYRTDCVKGATPLILACMGGNPELVKGLLESGADPKLACSTGETALSIAFIGGYRDVAKTLINSGLTTEDGLKKAFENAEQKNDPATLERLTLAKRVFKKIEKESLPDLQKTAAVKKK